MWYDGILCEHKSSIKEKWADDNGQLNLAPKVKFNLLPQVFIFYNFIIILFEMP